MVFKSVFIGVYLNSSLYSKTFECLLYNPVMEYIDHDHTFFPLNQVFAGVSSHTRKKHRPRPAVNFLTYCDLVVYVCAYIIRMYVYI